MTTPTPQPRPTRRYAASRMLAMILLAVLTAGCAASTGQFVWASDYVSRDPATADSKYVIGSGDLIAIQVYDNDKVSIRSRVRSDGKVAMPLVNDVLVAGKTPSQAALDVEKALRDGRFILAPRVNVVVEDIPAVRVTVLGAVARAGNLSLDQGAGVAEALAGAGGLTEFAHKDRIFVLRKSPVAARIRFTFAALTATGAASAFRLKQGDVVVVE